MQGLRRHLGLIAAITVLAAAATAVFAWLRPPSYRSHSDLLVATGFLTGAYGPQVKPPFQTQAQVLVSQAKLASEPQVATVASALLGGRVSPAAISSAVTVSASPNLDVITVTGTSRHGPEARAITAAYAQAVVQRARNQARHEILGAAARVSAALAANPSGARRAQLLELQRRLALLAAGTDGGVQITQPATQPSDANVPAAVLIGLGALAGLVLGVLAALAVDRLEHRVGERSLAELGIRPLGRIGSSDESARAVALVLDDAAAAALARIIVVAGDGPGRPAAAATAALARGLGETGRRVIAVDSDLARPALHNLWGLDLQPGLAGAIDGSLSDIGSALQPVSLAPRATGSVRLLAAGAMGASDHELAMSGRGMGDTLAVLEPLGDYLLIAAEDGPNAIDVRLIARHAHGIVMAVTDPGTPARRIDALHRALTGGRAPLLGAVVVNAATATAAGRA